MYIEATRAGTAWVQVKDAFAFLYFGTMSVAAHNHRDTCGHRIDIEVVQGVNEVKQASTEFHRIGGRKRTAFSLSVNIAAYSSKRSEIAEPVQSSQIAYISRVKYVFHSLQRLDRLGSQEAVGIGDHADVQAVHRELKGSRVRGSRKSRNASPMKLNESTASMTAMAGKNTRCGESKR
jgi:hypothetical protein